MHRGHKDRISDSEVTLGLFQFYVDADCNDCLEIFNCFIIGECNDELDRVLDKFYGGYYTQEERAH